MKKINTLFILFFFICSFLKAQTSFDLYSVCFINDSPTIGFGVSKIDPNNGNVTLLSRWKIKSPKGMGNIHAIDSKNKMCYQIYMGAWNLSILKIDINTGIVVDTVFTQDSVGTGDTTLDWVSGDINSLFYNCVDDQVYFLYKTKNKKIDNSSVIGTRLAKIDGVTGKVNLVTIFPLDLYAGQQNCNKTQQKIVLYHGSSSNEISIYDLQTHKLSSVAFSRNYDFNKQSARLLMDANDNQLYGYQLDYRSSATSLCTMIKVDPANGMVTDLSGTLDTLILDGMCFDPTNSKLIFMDLPDNPGYPRLCSFDIHTKKRSVILTEDSQGPNLYPGIYLNEDIVLDTAFTCKNFCQGVPSEFFSSTHNGSLEWDFGDPASGNLNLSDEIAPQHTYTQPGTYTVKMTSSNCWKSHTAIRTTSIASLPKIDLGNDITWCEHKKNEDLHLHVNAPGATYLWQDLTTADSYTVSKAGLYWVKVTNPSCEVADTLIVNEMPCDCEITVLPTITHATVSVIFECDLSIYNQLGLEIYNERSQIVFQKNITESRTNVNFEEFAAGIYFYRIRDKNSMLKSGKIVLVK